MDSGFPVLQEHGQNGGRTTGFHGIHAFHSTGVSHAVFVSVAMFLFSRILHFAVACWCFVFLGAVFPLAAAEWQWSVEVPPLADRAFEKPRAFLWIPPACDRVRGIVFAQHNMEEQAILESPVFRETLADLNFAAIWVAPGLDLFFRDDQDAGEKFDAMARDLAAVSGYAEISSAPLAVLGHSAAASTPWILAAWRPDRVIAGLSVSGQFPTHHDPKNMPHMEGRPIGNVPGLVALGEYEWASDGVAKAEKLRAEHPAMPFSYLVCPADGHFIATEEKIRFLALYLEKAARHRLPDPDGGALRTIDPDREGWLTTSPSGGDPTAMPVSGFTGKKEKCFWWFDEEIARAAVVFQARHRGKAALLGFIQEGRVLEQTPGTHQQVSIDFRPDLDGVTFRLEGTFIDKVPAGRPEKWSGLTAGQSIEVPPDGPPVEIHRITGPIRRIDATTWRLEMDRTSHLRDRRGNEAWLAAVWPGDARWKRAIQQARLNIPRSWKEGEPQTIDFKLPEYARAGTQEIPLSATSSSGLPVRFYVREGPAEISGNRLVLKPIPPRATYPVAITVVAWQFGRGDEPRIRTAEPVLRVIRIEKPR